MRVWVLAWDCRKVRQVDLFYTTHDDEMNELYEVYKKRKLQKARIKEELMPIA